MLVIAVLVLIVLLGLFALLRSTSGPSEDGGEKKNEPTHEPAKENAEEAAAGGAVVRVSGTEGTTYQGTYGTPEEVRTVQGTVGTEPTDYEVDAQSVQESALTAVFRKPRLDDEGTLKVQILYNDEVVAESETTTELGEVNVNWSAREGSAERSTTFPNRI